MDSDDCPRLQDITACECFSGRHNAPKGDLDDTPSLEDWIGAPSLQGATCGVQVVDCGEHVLVREPPDDEFVQNRPIPKAPALDRIMQVVADNKDSWSDWLAASGEDGRQAARMQIGGAWRRGGNGLRIGPLPQCGEDRPLLSTVTPRSDSARLGLPKTSARSMSARSMALMTPMSMDTVIAPEDNLQGCRQSCFAANVDMWTPESVVTDMPMASSQKQDEDASTQEGYVQQPVGGDASAGCADTETSPDVTSRRLFRESPR